MPWTARTAIIASFVLLGCEQPSPPPAEATLIRALAVQVSQFDRTSALTGEIQARHESNLGFRVGGKVIERLVDVGKTVAEGDLLARLDSQDQQNALKSAQSDVAAAQAFVEQSRTQEERQRKLLADGYTTRNQYDNAQRRYTQAQAELSSAQAKLRSAQDTLSYTELRADRAGVITAKGAEPGQVVASGQMVVRLADPNEREAVFQVPGAGLRLNGGAEMPAVEVRLVGDQNLVTEGTIREISPGVDPITRTYTVKVALIRCASGLPAGIIRRRTGQTAGAVGHQPPVIGTFPDGGGRAGGLGRRSAAGYGEPAAGVRPAIRYRARLPYQAGSMPAKRS